MIRALEDYWAEQGCVLMQPYHTELAAGTMNPATFLRCLGPRPWKTALRRARHPAARRALRRKPMVWCDGMEITQWTYFQQLGGFDVELVPAEMTYGLERLAMFLQRKSSAFDLEWAPGVTWGDVYRESERQWSTYNFELAPVDVMSRRFTEQEEECKQRVERRLPLPAYDQVLKCSHTMNLLDARGALSVTERAAYVGRVRTLAREVAQLYLELEGDGDAAA